MSHLWILVACRTKRVLSIFNEVFFFKMLCAVCQHQDFLQVTSIQGTQMRRRNGLGIFDGLRKFFGETHQLLSYPAFPTSLTLGWQSSPNNLNGFLLDKELDT